jgi:hypothetical protein
MTGRRRNMLVTLLNLLETLPQTFIQTLRPAFGDDKAVSQEQATASLHLEQMHL